MKKEIKEKECIICKDIFKTRKEKRKVCDKLECYFEARKQRSKIYYNNKKNEKNTNTK
jgi:hypothetical protein